MTDTSFPRMRNAVAPLLEVRNLRVGLDNGPPILNGVDLTLYPGRFTALVGESGAGKSLTALSLMRLLPTSFWLRADRLCFENRDLLVESEAALRGLRGNRIAMVFQDASSALNPVMNIGDQIIETHQTHFNLGRRAARIAAVDLLRRMGLEDPERQLGAFPHQLSGGMQQRVMIAMAIVCRPTLLIADEPTSALDVTVRHRILDLVDRLRQAFGTTVLFITHDLDLVGTTADEIAVMYAGRIVERGSRSAMTCDPMHPYTLALLAARPQQSNVGGRLMALDGHRSAPGGSQKGCGFAHCCPFALDECALEVPPMREIGAGHFVACARAPIEEQVA